MSTPRHRIVRPAPAFDPSIQQRQRRTQTLRGRLDQERTSLRRLLSRLKRAFHAVQRIVQRISRVDRQLASLEES